MANVKISNLPAASTPLTGAELVPIVKSGITSQTTVGALALDPLATSAGSSLVGFLQSGSGAVATTVQAKLRETVSVKDFGAVGNGSADDTNAIQKAINYASNSNVMTIYFPAGTYNYTTLYCYYDAINNPEYNVNRNGEIILLGDGIKPENGGTGGTTLYCTKTSGYGLNVGSAANDTNPYNTRDFVCKNISFEGVTSDYLVFARGVVSARIEECQFIQNNASGSALWITSAYFGILEKCRFQNNGIGTKTGDAIKFGTTVFAGLYTIRNCNISGYSNGLNFYAGDWQLMSIYDTEISGSAYGIYIGGGVLQTLNIYGSYFEGACTSYIASAVANCLKQFQLNGCWFYAAGATAPCISLNQPNSVTITNSMAQDLRSSFLFIDGISSGGIPNYLCQGVIFTFTSAIPSAITCFTGIVPALLGVEYPNNNSKISLYASTERPITYDPYCATTSYLAAGHILETKIKNYGAVTGGSVSLQSDGFVSMAWLYNLTTATTVYLPEFSTGLPNGFTATITSDYLSTANPVVKTSIIDGATTLGNISAGTQRKFVFFNDGFTTGNINSGSATLTVVNGANISNGMTICVAGAGSAGNNFITTVSSGGGTSTLTLATTASTTVSAGAVVGFGTTFGWK